MNEFLKEWLENGEEIPRIIDAEVGFGKRQKKPTTKVSDAIEEPPKLPNQTKAQKNAHIDAANSLKSQLKKQKPDNAELISQGKTIAAALKSALIDLPDYILRIETTLGMQTSIDRQKTLHVPVVKYMQSPDLSRPRPPSSACTHSQAAEVSTETEPLDSGMVGMDDSSPPTLPMPMLGMKSSLQRKCTADINMDSPPPPLKRMNAMRMNPSDFPGSSNSTAPSPVRKVYGLTVHSDNCIHLPGEVKVSAQKLLLVPSKKGSENRTVYAVTALVMTKEEMKSYSVSGKQANVHVGKKPPKPELPKDLKSAVSFLCAQIHPDYPETKVMNDVAKKLNMACKKVSKLKNNDNGESSSGQREEITIADNRDSDSDDSK